MAKDPEGYLQWADGEIQKQISGREERLKTLSQRRAEIEGRQDKFAANYDDLENVHKRLETALQKAEEEDHWPFRMGGHTFTREKAKTVLEQTKRQLEERRPLVESYRDALAKLEKTAETLRQDINRLTALRDKLSVDLEQVRIGHGLSGLDKLRTTEAEISHYAKILGSLAQEAGGALFPLLQKQPAPVDIDALLK